MSTASSARRAVAYIRVEGGGARAEDVRERRLIEGWAAREQVEVASWQTDVGVSPMTPIAERPGLLAAYRAISEHQAGILVAANAEQFSRDELVAWLIERAALTQGAVLETADGSRVGRGRAADAATAAPPRAEVGYTRGAIDLARAHERVSFRERMRRSAEERKARGLRVGNVPFGYRLAADGVHLEPCDAEQAIIRAVEQLSESGLSQRAIARELLAQGVAGRTGAPLGQTQIASILRASRSAAATSEAEATLRARA